MNQRTTRTSLIIAAWMGLVLLACNLTSGPEPPTVAPRATATPPPTISYATLSPAELPAEVAPTAPPLPLIEANLLNLTNQVETDRLMFHIDRLQNFRTRHVNSPTNLPDWGVGAAAAYISRQFEEISMASQGRLVVFDHPFQATFAGVTSDQRNIVAYLTGTEEGAGTILLGAHYDSISVDFEDGSAYAPGANDNGSGVAALLELARILSARPHRSSIMFVAFAAEEVNRQGSIAFVRDYMGPPRNIDLNVMINMDIIGSYRGPGGTIDDRNIRLFSAGPDDSPSRRMARMIELIAIQHVPNMTIWLQDRVDRENRYGDHMSFSEAGYGAVRFTQALEDLSRQHNDRDTIDGIQGVYLTRVTQTILTIVTALADGLRPPADMSLRDAGNGMRTLIWTPVPGASGYVVALRRPNSIRYDQTFPVTEPGQNTITWDRFTPENYYSIAIAARDAAGLMGPLSAEYIIR